MFIQGDAHLGWRSPLITLIIMVVVDGFGGNWVDKSTNIMMKIVRNYILQFHSVIASMIFGIFTHQPIQQFANSVF